MSEWELDLDIRSAADRLDGERDERLRLATSMIRLGVPFLDRATGGMRKTDLLLVGAYSGAGKTELVSTIARANVAKGKRVHFFALEAEEREIERRIIYKYLAKAFYDDPKRPKVNLTYRNWLLGLVDNDVYGYETYAQKIFKERYGNLFTIYRKREFGVLDLERYLMFIKDKSDLVIIDHLSYFDFDDGKNENQAVTEVVKKIRDLALLTRLPIILVTHLRKKDRFSKAIAPSLDDVFGSSNVAKIATQAVLMASAQTTEPEASPTLWPTYIRIAKDRVDGSVTKYIARCNFDSARNEYEKDYTLSRWREGLEQFEPITNLDHLPRWARGA